MVKESFLKKSLKKFTENSGNNRTRMTLKQKVLASTIICAFLEVLHFKVYLNQTYLLLYAILSIIYIHYGNFTNINIILHSFLICITIIAVNIIVNPDAEILTILSYIGPTLSIIFGTSILLVITNKYPRITSKTKPEEKHSFKKRNIVIMLLHITASILMGVFIKDNIFLGIAIIPTLIWIEALTLHLLVKDKILWTKNVIIGSISIIVAVMIFQWNAISFLRYSAYEYFLAYKEYAINLLIQIIVILILPHINLQSDIEMDKISDGNMNEQNL